MPFFQGGGGHGTFSNVHPSKPAPKPFLGNIGRALSNVGRSVSHTTSAVAHHPVSRAPASHPFSFSGPRTDAQTSGAGYGSARANAFKNTPAYHHALSQASGNAGLTPRQQLALSLFHALTHSGAQSVPNWMMVGPNANHLNVKGATVTAADAVRSPFLEFLNHNFRSQPWPSDTVVGPGGGLYFRNPGGPDRLPQQPATGDKGHLTTQIPIPLAVPGKHTGGLNDALPASHALEAALHSRVQPGGLQSTLDAVANTVAAVAQHGSQHAVPAAQVLADTFSASPSLAKQPAFATDTAVPKQRLFADPSRPASFAAGGAQQAGASPTKALQGTIANLLKIANSGHGKNPPAAQVKAVRDLVSLAQTYPAVKSAILRGGKGAPGKTVAHFINGGSVAPGGASAAAVLQSAPSLRSLTVRGQAISPSQLAAASQIVQIGKHLHASPSAIAGVITDAIYESTLNPNDPGNPRYGGLLAGAVNDGTFAPGSAGAAAEIRSAFLGGKGFQGGGAIGQANSGNRDLLKIAETISGSGTQHASQTGSSAIPPEGARIAEALLKNRVPIASGGSSSPGGTVGFLSPGSVGASGSSAGGSSGGSSGGSGGGSSAGATRGASSPSRPGKATSAAPTGQSTQQAQDMALLSALLSSNGKSPYDFGPQVKGLGGSNPLFASGLLGSSSSSVPSSKVDVLQLAHLSLQQLAGVPLKRVRVKT